MIQNENDSTSEDNVLSADESAMEAVDTGSPAAEDDASGEEKSLEIHSCGNSLSEEGKTLVAPDGRNESVHGFFSELDSPVLIGDIMDGTYCYENATGPAYLLEGLLRYGEVSVIAGASNSGKTFITLSLAIAVASGASEWAGKKIYGKQRGVLYINAEDSRTFPARVKGTMAGLCGTRELAALKILNARHKEGVQLLKSENSRKFIDEIGDYIRRYGISLVVIDPLTVLFPGNDSDIEYGEQVIAVLKEIADATGAAIVVCQHISKKNSFDAKRARDVAPRGSSVIKDHADTAFGVLRYSKGLIEMDSLKLRNDKLLDESLWFRHEMVKVSVLPNPEADPCQKVTETSIPYVTPIVAEEAKKIIPDEAPKKPKAKTRKGKKIWSDEQVFDIIYKAWECGGFNKDPAHNDAPIIIHENLRSAIKETKEAKERKPDFVNNQMRKEGNGLLARLQKKVLRELDEKSYSVAESQIAKRLLDRLSSN